MHFRFSDYAKLTESVRIKLSSWEPPIGIEPMTYALREACSLPAHALAAPIAPVIALMTPAALGLSGHPVHEPVRAGRSQHSKIVTKRSDWNSP